MIDDFFHIEGFKYQHSYLPFKTHSNQEIKIAHHHYSPAQRSTRSLTLIAGYSENCGYHKSLIKYFLNHNFNLHCFDLPGHGLSTGQRFSIDHFNTYKLFHQAICETLNPLHYNIFLAHSTGAFGFTQHLLKHNESPFKKAILLAPLTRVRKWALIKIAHLLLSNFLTRFPRSKRNRVKEYALSRKNDPYSSDFVSLEWLSKLIEFNTFKKTNKKNLQNNLHIFLGDKDEVIDWKHSNVFYRTSFPNAEITVIKKGTHHFHLGDHAQSKEFYSCLEKIILEN